MSTLTEPSTATEAPTRIRVTQEEGRPRVTLSGGQLRPRLVHSRPGWCRVGLLATTALLLGGDHVDLRVEVGPGARLSLFDVAGTVAYDGRGSPASWWVRASVADGGELRMAGEPFVVSTGATVTRVLDLDLAANAVAAVRDTIVLGRSGESGGRLRNQTSIRVGGELICLEDQDLDPELRVLPGMLGRCRVLDTITTLGRTAPPLAPGSQSSTQFQLVGGGGAVTRYLGDSLASSPVHEAWRTVTG